MTSSSSPRTLPPATSGTTEPLSTPTNEPAIPTAAVAAAAAASPTTTTPPKIYTYHCICTQLLLATPYDFSTLPRRKRPSTTNPKYIASEQLVEIILPLGVLPSSNSTSGTGAERAGVEGLVLDDDDDDDDGDAIVRRGEEDAGVEEGGLLRGVTANSAGAAGSDKPASKVQASLLLSTTLDRRPIVLRREDGYEKVRLRRCARCRVCVGYGIEGDGEGPATSSALEKEVGKVVYLFEGGLRESGEL
ncbi:hypothetical protein MMC25_007834 [Agyrium rufum]|nr:hypothetical protein [Agyrium rufum]